MGLVNNEFPECYHITESLVQETKKCEIISECDAVAKAWCVPRYLSLPCRNRILISTAHLYAENGEI